MSSSQVQLDDDQKFGLMKFRRNVNDVLLPHHSDIFLLRWLRARSWNTEAAEKMLRDSLKWRQLWGVDTNLKTWEPNEPLASHYPSGNAGYDKDGSPVIIVPFAGLDMIGILHSTSRQDMVRMTIKILEENLELAAKTGSNQVVAIFDMDGFTLKQYAWRPAVEVVISLIKMYEANYPEILKTCYIVNAPRVFSIAFSVVKNFLNEYTISKIQIYKSDASKWRKILTGNIGTISELPKYYGGELIDPDGNPKCPSKIRPGGKIPKSYYTKRLTDKQKEFTSVTVKKGEKVTLDFVVAEEGSCLKWDFRTEGHDIRFGISCQTEDGNISYAIRPHRVASHQVDEAGVIVCQAPATYTVIFDNSYSMLRSKKILYSVYLTLPLNKLNVTTTPNNDENTDCSEIEENTRKLSVTNHFDILATNSTGSSRS